MIKMFGMTAVHITHDQSEAMALADSVICMRSGKIEQEGKPRDIYRKPANRYVAEFIGASTFLPGDIVGVGDNVLVDIGNGVCIALAAGNLTPAKSCVLAVRPESVSISRTATSGINHFAAVIERETFLGAQSEYQLKFEGHTLKALSPEDFSVGEKVWITIDPRNIVSLG
jgi:iron(III) transport system ATP-binding protein